MEIIITKLCPIVGQKGDFLSILEEAKINKAYISTINPNEMKGFYKHSNKISNLLCLKGRVRFFFSSSNSIDLDASDPVLITVPANIVYGWKNISSEVAWLLNICFLGKDNHEERFDVSDKDNL